MFKQLVIMLLSIAGITQKSAAEKLGYKTPSALQGAIINKDLKLSVLNNICKLCGLSIIITDHKSININVTEYIQSNTSLDAMMPQYIQIRIEEQFIIDNSLILGIKNEGKPIKVGDLVESDGTKYEVLSVIMGTTPKGVDKLALKVKPI